MVVPYETIVCVVSRREPGGSRRRSAGRHAGRFAARQEQPFPVSQQHQLRVTRATLATQLEHALRDEILSGELQPGTRLRAEEIAARYGVSPTPTREALQRLLADSLISLDPRAGIQVAQVSLEELRDVYRVPDPRSSVRRWPRPSRGQTRRGSET